MARIGKLWTDSTAYLALVGGAGVSIAGNIADTYRTRGTRTDELDIFMAAFWPAVVVLMVEIFVSTRWRELDWPMQVLRWAGCLAIGGMAMRVSWVHLNDLMLSRGQKADVATLGPLAIDLLAIMATALILAGRGQDTTGPGVLDKSDDLVDAASTGQDTPTLRTGQDSEDMSIDAFLDKWTGPVDSEPAKDSEDTPLPRRTPDMDKLSELSIADEVEAHLRGLASQLPPPRPAPATARRLTDDQAREVRWLMAAAQDHHDGPSIGEARQLLAAWFGVSVKTIQRRERG